MLSFTLEICYKLIRTHFLKRCITTYSDLIFMTCVRSYNVIVIKTFRINLGLNSLSNHLQSFLQVYLIFIFYFPNYIEEWTVNFVALNICENMILITI